MKCRHCEQEAIESLGGCCGRCDKIQGDAALDLAAEWRDGGC